MELPLRRGPVLAANTARPTLAVFPWGMAMGNRALLFWSGGDVGDRPTELMWAGCYKSDIDWPMPHAAWDGGYSGEN